jgi:hypothetical protein
VSLVVIGFPGLQDDQFRAFLTLTGRGILCNEEGSSVSTS